MDTLTDERPLASAVRFLLEGDEREAASLLLLCSASLSEPYFPDRFQDDPDSVVDVHLVGPRKAYDAFSEYTSSIREAVLRAFQAVLPEDLGRFTIRAELLEVEPEWRNQYQALATGQEAMNQAPYAKDPHVWNGLRFNSASEVKIAEALDRAKVLFLPNCYGRVGIESRLNRGPDFLVCQSGKWGILEVDGEPFHPASRTVEDHNRDRLFKLHGVKVVEHFDASECFQTPDQVVRRFLAILDQA